MPANTYSPPGSDTLTVIGTRNYNDEATFVVTIGEGPNQIVSPVLGWPEAWTLLVRYGAGGNVETMLRAALEQYDADA